jgi:hypothetical protein
MLVPYQLPQFSILIIPQMVKGKNFFDFPFLLQLENFHKDFFK